jgi:hypothetical protein
MMYFVSCEAAALQPHLERLRIAKDSHSPPARWPFILSPAALLRAIKRMSGYPNAHAYHIRHAIGTYKRLSYHKEQLHTNPHIRRQHISCGRRNLCASMWKTP